MPNVSNPNRPSKNRLAARASKLRKQRQKKSEEGKNKIAKADSTRGARPGLLPTSGPNKRISAKKARKLEKKLGYAVKRKMEAEGVVEMMGKSLVVHFLRELALGAGWSVGPREGDFLLTMMDVDAPMADEEAKEGEVEGEGGDEMEIQ